MVAGRGGEGSDCGLVGFDKDLFQPDDGSKNFSNVFAGLNKNRVIIEGFADRSEVRQDKRLFCGVR